MISQRNPYISFVLAARNDNYGGHFLHRITAFFTVLLFYIQKYSLSSEIIVVEWNPPPKRPRLYQELQKIIAISTVPIRFIEVSSQIHHTFANSDKMPIFEYIAKNVGIRRARGKYILVTNPDILFPEKLIKFLAAHHLNPHAFYRVGRFDVQGLLPQSNSIEDHIHYAKKHSFRLNGFGQTVSIIPWLPFPLKSFFGYTSVSLHRFYRRKEKRIEDKLYVNAAGDFLLAARTSWYLCRGYPELPTHYLIDGYLCCIMACKGLRQEILQNNFSLFHYDHDRPTDNRPKTSYKQWLAECKQMLTKGKPKIQNTTSWGLKNEVLKEITFVL